MFAAIAPLFAIQDYTRDDDRFWNLTELILGALAIGLFAARFFEMQYLVNSLVQAIVLSLAFVGSSFAHRKLGSWSGHFTTMIFWITIEYAFLKSPWSGTFLLLGTAFSLKTEWLGWTQYTGYLGISLWILIANLFLYYSFLRKEKIQWSWLIPTLLWITVPVALTFGKNMHPASLNKYDQVAHVKNKENFIQSHEVIPVAATGLSFLILLVAATRNKKHK